jgi:hypothetical protein
VAANEWRTDCNFNEPVVSGTSHRYHYTDCRQLKLLRFLPFLSSTTTWQINCNRREARIDFLCNGRCFAELRDHARY